jgi:thiamine-phosphate pyrophosphorylase
VPPDKALAARDTLGDVGTEIETPRERRRYSVAGVIVANLRRLTEALRTLEELAKLSDACVARRLEQLRYRCYTIEKALVLTAQARNRLAGVRLCVLVSGASCTAALDWTIAEAAAGGAQAFQLREKELDDRALLDRARRMRRWTRDAGALFVVNNRPDIARLADADGVHLGQDDISVRDARRIVGTEVLIGVSTHNLEQLQRALLEGASYVGVGPTYASRTKGFECLAGIDYVKQAVDATKLPLFAIGGIDESNASAVIQAGARRLAVSRAICAADDPRRAAARLLHELEAANPQD